MVFRPLLRRKKETKWRVEVFIWLNGRDSASLTFLYDSEESALKENTRFIDSLKSAINKNEVINLGANYFVNSKYIDIFSVGRPTRVRK